MTRRSISVPQARPGPGYELSSQSMSPVSLDRQTPAAEASSLRHAADRQGRGRELDKKAPAKPQLHLRLLATSDLHGEILSYDYFRNRPQFGQGLAQTAHLIAEARAEVPGTLLFDNGDFMQGSALAEYAALAKRRRLPHPAIAAFNALKYDAVGLGNHEFNYGLELLQAALAEAEFPVVSANIAHELAADGPAQDRHLVRPYVLLTRKLPDQFGAEHQITIGVLGLTPPQILQWDRQHLEGKIAVRPMVEAARAFVPLMRAAGADVVVCLAHTGIAPTQAPRRAPALAASTASSAAAAEADAIDLAAIVGVDAVIAGHSHLVFPREGHHPDPRVDQAGGTLLGKPCVLPGHSGSHLGQIDLRLERMGTGWRVASSQAAAISTSAVLASLNQASIRHSAAPLRQAVMAQHRATLSWLRREIAVTEVPLTTHFAHVIDSQATRLIAAALTDYVQARMAETRDRDLPVIASVSPFRSGGRGGPLNYTDIPAGKLSLRAIFDLYPYPNRLVAKRITGAELRQRLEQGTAPFNRLLPGRGDQMLLDPTVPGFSYEIISGLTYQIDLSQPLVQQRNAPVARLASGMPRHRGRIVGLASQGRPVRDQDEFIFVTNSFAKPVAEQSLAPIVLDDQALCGEVVSDWAARRGVIAPQTGPGWRLAPMPGTSVLVNAGAGAMSHLAEVAAYHPEFLGLTVEGFQQFRLHL